jgi:hypothetical protein
MLVGSAVKEVIVGTEPLPGGVLDEVIDPQPASPAQANRMRTSEQRSTSEGWSPGELRFLHDESVESIRNPKQTQSIAHAVLAVALRGPSPLGPPALFVNQVIRVIRRSTLEMIQSNGRSLFAVTANGKRLMESAEPGFQAPGKGQPAPEGHEGFGSSHRADDPETPVFGQPRRRRRRLYDPVDSATCKAKGEGILSSFAAAVSPAEALVFGSQKRCRC